MPRAKRTEALETTAAGKPRRQSRARASSSTPESAQIASDSSEGFAQQLDAASVDREAESEPQSVDSTQDASFDPTFGFAAIMPQAMAQMNEAISRMPGMDWISRLQGKPPAALRIDQTRLMALQAEYTQRTQQLLKLAASVMRLS